MTGEKLNYFLTDTLPTSRDSVLRIVLDNFDLLSYAKKLAPRAYAGAGAWERAFEFADSLKSVSGFEEIMTLELKLLALDSSGKGIYLLQDDENLHQAVTALASDSTKDGFWQARAVLHQVFGNNMHLKYLLPESGGERFARPTDNEVQEQTLNKADETHLAGFILYPNPASDEVYLAFRGDKTEQGHFRLLDPLGKVLLEVKSDSRQTARISTSGLQNGVYFIDLIGTSVTPGVKKLIIQR